MMGEKIMNISSVDDFKTDKDCGVLPIQVGYGSGINSESMLVGMKRRNIRPDFILFADTGGEKPHTYSHIENVMNPWCEKNGFPLITTIRANGKTLEQDCLDRNALPSVAYGFKTCSQRWKIQVQEQYMRKQGIKEYIRYVGFDYDEPHRAKEYPNTVYPLIEWKMGRDECIALIEDEGLPLAGKSACFFCPNSKASEVVFMAQKYPDLADRALAMESNADLNFIAGLGRNWSWKNLIAQQEMFPMDEKELDKVFPIHWEQPCGCIG